MQKQVQSAFRAQIRDTYGIIKDFFSLFWHLQILVATQYLQSIVIINNKIDFIVQCWG